MCGWEEWPDAKTWTIKLKTETVSQNALGAAGRGRGGWAYRSHRRRFERALAAQYSSYAGAVGARGVRRAIVTRYYRRGRRPYDYGNLVGGCKPLIDSLKEACIIRDDSPKYFSGYYKQQPSADGTDYIVVVIQERIIA